MVFKFDTFKNVQNVQLTIRTKNSINEVVPLTIEQHFPLRNIQV